MKSSKVLAIAAASLLCLGLIAISLVAPAIGLPPRHDLSGQFAGGPGQTSQDITLNALAKNDVIVVFEGTIGGGTLSVSDTGSNSWTAVGSAETESSCSGTTCEMQAWTTTAKASAASDVVTVSSSIPIYMEEYVYNIGPYSTAGLSTSAGDGTGAAGAVASYTPAAGSLILATYVMQSYGGCTAGSGYFLIGPVSNYGVSQYDYSASGSATTSPVTCGGTAGYAGISVSLPPPATTTTSTVTTTTTTTTTVTTTSTVTTTTTVYTGQATVTAVTGPSTVTSTATSTATSTLTSTIANSTVTSTQTSTQNVINNQGAFAAVTIGSLIVCFVMVAILVARRR